ncbi:hypothetical protein SAMN03159288_04350 [Rhizobium sp. NFACC06-2]|nr:hypothetical protein SAMN03159288_04350 [Rhizobium sp. NFACC06-2]
MSINCLVITLEPRNLSGLNGQKGAWVKLRPDACTWPRLCQDNPNDTGQLGSQSYGHLVNVHSQSQGIDPDAKTIFAAIEMQHA